MIKRILSTLSLICFLVTTLTIPVLGASETSMYHIDSINGTRWQDYLCVYQDREHTGQNQWGYNIVVSSEGIVTAKIPSGNNQGQNLAIPKGGMVVSGTGDVAKEMYNSAKIGGKCLFDEYSMRVYFSEGEINPFYTETIRITGYNSTRWEDTVIIYNHSGQTTGTNVWGYEVCVDADGYITSAGGNNNVIPKNGYVISAINSNDKAHLAMYFTVGAKCTIKNSTITVTYGKEQLVKTAESELTLIKEALKTAKSQYKLIDYNTIETTINKIKTNNISTLEERNAIIKQIQSIYPMLVESKSVETRSVWYEPTERTATAIKNTVAAMKEAGINELVLCVNSSQGSLVPVDSNKIPFKKDSIVQSLDVLQSYINECRAKDISIVLWVPVFSGSYVNSKDDWKDVTNTGIKGKENFLSPANSEYRKAFMDYIEFIIDKYDIDGLQLDYIRYSQFYDGVDSGYDEATIKLFQEKTGNDASVVKEIGKQLTNHPKWKTWWNFKVELVNSWVKEIYGIVKSHSPEIYVSAAVAASNGVSGYCQDPAAWVKGGYIDGIYVMSYAEEINETTTKPHTTVRGDKSYLVMGCGAYLSISNLSLITQTDNSSVLGADGTAYFEWSAVVDHGQTDILKDSLFKDDAIPFTGDVNTVVTRLVATAKERILLYCKSADAETAKELKNIVSSLPDKGADKNTINNIISKLIAVLDNDIEKYLTADLMDAIRAINMTKTSNSGSNDNPDRDPVVEDTESNSEMTESTMENTESNNENTEINSEDTEIDSDNMESNITDETESATDSDFEQSTDNSNKKLELPIISITCAIIIILVLIIVIAIILKNRKNNNQITE